MGEEDRKIASQVLKQLRYRNPNDRNPGSSRQVGDVIQPEAHVEAGQGETEAFIRGNLYEGHDVLTVSFLRKLLKYCKMMCQPDLSSAAVETMAEFYRDVRQRSQKSGGPSGLPVTTRLLEACIRLATAHAKLKLRPEVTKEDVQVAKDMIRLCRNEEPDVEIPGAAAVEAPAAGENLDKESNKRDKEFNNAVSKVFAPQKFDSLDLAEFLDQLNQNLGTGVQAFDENEAQAQLIRLK